MYRAIRKNMSPIIRLALVIFFVAATSASGKAVFAQTENAAPAKPHKSTADDIPWSLSAPSTTDAKTEQKAKKPSEPKVSLYERMLKSGDEQMANEEYTLARKTFRELCWRRPIDPVPMLREAQAAAKCGDLDDALVWAKKATQYAPNYNEAHIQLGHLLEANRDWKAAYLQYERTFDLAKDAESRIALETPMLRTLIKAQDFDKADRLSTTMIKQNKKAPDCYYNRAWYLAQTGKAEALAEAIEAYKQVLLLSPSRNDARFNLALLLLKNNDKEEAAAQLRKFIEEGPGDADCPRAKEILKTLESSQ